MTPEEKNDLETRLNDEAEATRRDIERLEELTKPIPPDSALGRLTRMDAIGGKGVNEAALRNSREKLIKLEQAVEKLAGSSYGICEVCQRPISKARLEALPESSRCVVCASR